MLTERDVKHYRAVLVNHRNQGPQHHCLICRVRRCPEWVRAYDRLAAAGKLMKDECERLAIEAGRPGA